MFLFNRLDCLSRVRVVLAESALFCCTAFSGNTQFHQGAAVRGKLGHRWSVRSGVAVVHADVQTLQVVEDDALAQNSIRFWKMISSIRSLAAGTV